MKLGVIGPSDSVYKIVNDLVSIDKNIEIKTYIREKVIDSVEVIEECERECSAVLFTGIAVYEYVKLKHNISIPHTFVDRSGSSIAKALWEIRNNNLNLNKFSIDVVDNTTIEDMIEELELNPKAMYCLPFSIDKDETEYIKWHTNLYDNKKVDVIITGFGAVYNELKRRGYPVFRLSATKPLVNVCYNKIKSKCALDRAQYSQIGVEILSINDKRDSSDSYYSNMIKRTELEKYIIEYAREIQGSLFPFGHNEYIVFANKGAIEQESNYINLAKLQKDIKSNGFLLSIGIGIGTTSYQAEINARKALRRSFDSNGKDIYQIDEDDKIKGPIGTNHEMNYALVSSDERILEISNKTGLSCESVLKLIALNETRKSKVYDSKELAGCLDVSERTARRILKKIIEADFARVFAKESSSGTGRPKNIIELLF